MKTPLSSSFLVSLGSLVCLGLVLSLGSCGRSGDKGSGQGSSETAPVAKDLGWCCENGDLEGVKAFLTPRNINGHEDQKPPLHLAAKGGHRNVVEFLISKGAKIDISNDWGDYPIHIAASNGHVDVIKILLDAGAKPDQKSNDRYSSRGERIADSKYQPIHSAARSNQPEVVKFFIALGISPEAKDGDGRSVFDYAVGLSGWREDRTEIIRLLDRDGEFEKGARHVISTEGYYITNEPTPKYIRFMPEKMESSSPYPYQRAVISFGPRGGTSPAEVSKWLSPYNEEAKKQGDFITGLYKMMKGYATISTFDSTYQGGDITLSHVGDQLRFSMQTMQASMFPSNEGSGDSGMDCTFVSWK